MAGSGRAVGGPARPWGGPRHRPIPLCNSDNNHNVTNKTSGRSPATGQDPVYESHVSLTQMGLLVDNLTQPTPELYFPCEHTALYLASNYRSVFNKRLP